MFVSNCYAAEMIARLFFLALGVAAALSAQGLEYVKAHYTKYEFRIPVRDGKRLFTSVYVPKDTSRTYPFLIQRTPYSVAPYGVDNYRANLGSERYAREGYIFVYQDVRGRYLSEGTFLEMTPHKAVKSGPMDVDESTDTYDTIDWLVKNVPNNNGRAGIVGISYAGFYAAAGMIDAHPALKAASPQAPIIDLFHGDDAYHNGAFFLAANFGFYTNFFEFKEPSRQLLREPIDVGRGDRYEFYLDLGPLSNADEKYFKNRNQYWTDLLKHTTYDDFWKARNLEPHIRNIKPAVLAVGGWFDAEDLAGPLKVFRAASRGAQPGQVTLVMGPWSHGAWSFGDANQLGVIHFRAKAGPFYRDNIEFPFFQHHLKGKEDPKLPAAYLFETGTNQWRKFAAWPPPEAPLRTLYFRAGGKLSLSPPDEAGAFDEYISDPMKPVPFTTGVPLGMNREYMVDDQRRAASRPDVLVYETDVLEEDVTIGGPVTVRLFASTSGTDSDWVVKVIDVYPPDYPDPDPNPAGVRMGGYQQLVRGEPFRGRFHKSFEKPEALPSNQFVKFEFAMPDVLHTFRRGHRIMVQVQSSWFPLVDRNPQKFVDIPTAKPSDFIKATQRINRSRATPSGIEVRVIR